MIMANMSTMVMVVPLWVSWYASPVQAKPNWLSVASATSFSIAAMPVEELTSGAMLAVIAAVRYML